MILAWCVYECVINVFSFRHNVAIMGGIINFILFGNCWDTLGHFGTLWDISGAFGTLLRQFKMYLQHFSNDWANASFSPSEPRISRHYQRGKEIASLKAQLKAQSKPEYEEDTLEEEGGGG